LTIHTRHNLAGAAEESEKKAPAAKVRRVSAEIPIEPDPVEQKPSEPASSAPHPHEGEGSNDDIPKDFSPFYLIKSEPNDYSVCALLQ
jgi:hypothetical protein